MKPGLLLTMVFSLFAGGCFTETRTYSLVVHNNLGTPISICVTKTHSPEEPGWESPEELASPDHPASENARPGMVIPPGKTLTSPPMTGDFGRQRGQAFLRVYLGTPTLNQMNAMSPGSSDRLDVPLNVGPNHLQIDRGTDGQITAISAAGQPVQN